MAVEVVTSGSEDRHETPWQMAIGGYPGTGKTMFASTAPDPLFLFFAENPRIKSIAERQVKYAKLVNEYDEDGALSESVLAKLLAVVRAIRAGDVECETLVIDTADEFFYAMKEARISTHGEFSAGDWGWIADFFRESMTSIVDLPVKVVVLFHLKRTGDDDGVVYEPAIQGGAKEEFPGWFDVVGVLEPQDPEAVEGGDGPLRVLRFVGTEKYPWVKDHSGDLPARLPVSDGFTGDYEAVMDYLAGDKSASQKEVTRESFRIINTVEEAEEESDTPVPTPEEVQAKKAEEDGPPEQIEGQTSLTAAIEMVKDIGGQEISEVCADCKGAIDNQNIAALAQEKFGKALCKECYKKENA